MEWRNNVNIQRPKIYLPIVQHENFYRLAKQKQYEAQPKNIAKNLNFFTKIN